jgi:uncharacterized protein (DUF427 family)
VKSPGPDHPIRLSKEPRRLRARAAGHVIADSSSATVLQEASYPAVAYFPRADVEMSLFSRTARKTVCPYKGDASYFSAFLDGQLLENVAWSYEAPYPAMAPIAGLIAFYADRVEIDAAD